MEVHRLDETDGGDDLLLTRYLLGELPDEERERLQDAYFEDDALFARLLRAEDDLIDAYVRGTLTAAERERFEQRFGRTPAQARRVSLARLLQRAADERNARGPAWPRWAIAVAAAMLLATVVGVRWWMTRQATRTGPAVAEQADHTRPPTPQVAGPAASTASVPAQPSPVHEPAGEQLSGQKPAWPQSPGRQTMVASLVLQPGLVRGGGATPKVALPPGTDAVQLRLELGPGLSAGAYPAYVVVVQTAAGAEVWRGGAPEIGTGVSPPSITVTLPARSLTQGDYVALVNGHKSDGTQEYLRGYSFRVAR